ncbi:MAG: hypothetical protein KDI13_10370 [Alphaproteobacteria bacterium]|nr:hypothetical protein [Alphaproteobacteria bacterium]
MSIKKQKNHEIRKGRKKSLSTILASILFFFVCAGFISVSSLPALACCLCTVTVNLSAPFAWDRAEDDFDQEINDQFLRLESFIVHQMWEKSILPVMMEMANEFSAVAMWQVQAIGMFIDAKQQMETQLVEQEIRARILKDFQPSESVCSFGTVVRSLAATQTRNEIQAIALGQRSLDRQLGNTNTADMYGNDLQNANRINHFRGKYCDENDRMNAMAAVCPTMKWTSLTSTQKHFINRDIDYLRTIETPGSLKVDFTNDQILYTSGTPNIHNEDEEDVMTLATNLFGFQNFPRPPARLLKNKDPTSLDSLSPMQEYYMDMRSIIAKRSVAENSYNTIVSLKSEGITTTNASGTQVPMNARVYMERIMGDLGVPSADILALIGDNPSYDAQMEILTKKMFQNPQFYVNLYDTPANVKRKAVAMQAIKLMQKFDMFKSYLRGEATFSILLELAVVDLQKEIEDEIRSVDVSGNRQ